MSHVFVTCTTKTTSPGKYHDHIESVGTLGGPTYTRAQAVQSINAGAAWYTYRASNPGARIEVVNDCGHGCSGAFIRTVPNATTADNLDSLPACQ